jgi:hypothetical protein
MRKRYIMIYLTHHVAGHALLGSPIQIGFRRNDFHGEKIIVSANFLVLYGVKDYEHKYYYHEERGNKNENGH